MFLNINKRTNILLIQVKLDSDILNKALGALSLSLKDE